MKVEEFQRYSRQIHLPSFGLKGQKHLQNKKALVIGAGGLGSPVLLYLAAAGLGEIGIIDHDTISLSNLQRQILFSTDEIGENKAEVAASKLKKLNPEIKVIPYPYALDNSNAIQLFTAHDLMIDCTDNFATRYLINDACVLADRPFIYGSIYQFEGQVSLFNDPLTEDRVTYRDLFPTPPPPNMVQNCAEGGVLGVLPGMIGSVQASEAILYLSETGNALSGKLWLMDIKTMESRTIALKPSKIRLKIEKLINYDYFCSSTIKKETMKELSVTELKNLLDKKEDIVLVDVREGWEHEMASIGGLHIPQGDIPVQFSKIPKDKKVVVYCRSGKRSANAIAWLESQQNFTNLINLSGGILAWGAEIDPSIPQY